MDPFNILFGEIKDQAAKAVESRTSLARVEPDANHGIGVSTVYTPDTQKYETALMYNEGVVVVVERYTTKKQALAGHKAWIAKAKDGLEVTSLGSPSPYGYTGDETQTIHLTKVFEQPQTTCPFCGENLGSRPMRGGFAATFGGECWFQYQCVCGYWKSRETGYYTEPNPGYTRYTQKQTKDTS